MATAKGDLTPNSKLGLLNKLRQNKIVIATFVLLKGVRAAQVLAHTGVDVRDMINNHRMKTTNKAFRPSLSIANTVSWLVFLLQLSDSSGYQTILAIAKLTALRQHRRL